MTYSDMVNLVKKYGIKSRIVLVSTLVGLYGSINRDDLAIINDLMLDMILEE